MADIFYKHFQKSQTATLQNINFSFCFVYKSNKVKEKKLWNENGIVFVLVEMENDQVKAQNKKMSNDFELKFCNLEFIRIITTDVGAL